MDWKYDPEVSSAEYLDIARKRDRRHDVKNLPGDLRWMLGKDFDFGVHHDHVDQLLDRSNWSDLVHRENRRPRVFIDSYVNQRLNVEIRCVAGGQDIYFESDFSPNYLRYAIAGRRDERNKGEIMRMQQFPLLQNMVVRWRCPVAKALLFGYKAKLDELIHEISAEVEVVGAMSIEISYEWKGVTGADFVPDISLDRLEALRVEADLKKG